MRIWAGVHSIDHSKFAYKYSVWPRKWKTGLIKMSTVIDGVNLFFTTYFSESSQGALVSSREENLIGSELLHRQINSRGTYLNYTTLP